MNASKIILSFFITLLTVQIASARQNRSTTLARSFYDGKFQCHCDVCASTNFRCRTNGFCYVARVNLNGSKIVTQRCYDGRVKSHFAFPTFCEKQYPKGITANCCKDDFCNDESILPPAKDDPTVIQTSSVTCHCSHCVLDNFMCKTDGKCYLSWRKTKEGLLFMQGCLDRKYLFPPDEPTYCEARQVADYGRMCCDRNFCDAEDLKLDPGLNVYALFFFIAFILSLSMIFYLNLR